MAQAESRNQTPRPLSPHLQIYRWTWTMAMSIFHRVTGVALYIGALVLAWFFLSIASGPEAYAASSWFFGSWFGYLVLFGFSWALMHHMLGGLRHFIWDFGRGFETEQRFLLAKLTLAGSVGLTLLIWIVILIAR